MQDLKKYSIRVMIGSLIAAAVLAVAVVLVGEFNDTFGKALGTIGLVTIHAFACLIYSEYMERTGKSDSSLSFFQNTLFALIVLSQFTSVLAVWELFDGEVTGKLYLTYFILAFASLHGSSLATMIGKTGLIDKIVWANYAFMAVVVFMFLPIIWLSDSLEFDGFYYRLLAAVGIIDATLTILATIYHMLYLQKHPEQKSVLFTVQAQGVDENGKPIKGQMTTQRRIHPLLWLLGFFLLLQVIGGIFGVIINAMR